MLRRIFLIDGCVMVALGALLWRSYCLFLPRSGSSAAAVCNASPGAFIDSLGRPPLPMEILARDETTIFLGVLLIVLGVVSLAFGYSVPTALRQKAALFFLAGHLFLGFTVWTLMTHWSMFAGFIVFDLMTWPIPALLYGLLPYRSVEAARAREATSTEQDIREAAGQEERNRLAQDLHDSVKQQIYSVQTNLATAEARWNDDGAGARAAIEHARKASRDAMAEMSALLDRLRRDPIESVGLVEALRRQCEALGFQTGAKVSTTFAELPPASRLPSGAITPIFRIAQEAMANIGRHARAKHVTLQLDTNTERKALCLEIRDDGCGFDTQSSGPGMGLRNMRLRAEEIGAELEIKSKDSAGSLGTVIRLWLPLIDIDKEQSRNHAQRLIAALIPAVPAAGLMVLWDGSAPFMLPFVAVGGGLVAFHLSALRKLKSA